MFFLGFFFPGEWIRLNEKTRVQRKKERKKEKKNGRLALRSGGSLHVPADVYIIAEWRRGAHSAVGLDLGERLTPQELLRGLSVLSR